MDTRPEVVRFRTPAESGEAREVSAWRVGPDLYLTASSHLLGPQPRDVRRVVVRAPGQADQVLVLTSDDEANLALLAPAVEGGAPTGGSDLVVEVLGATADAKEQWSLLTDAPTESASCLVLLSSARGGQPLLGRLCPEGDVLEVTTSPDAGVDMRALPGCPVVRGGKVVGLVTQRTREEGRVLAVTASTLLSLWYRRCGAGPQGWRQRSFAYGTIKLFVAAIADAEGWKRELSSVDPRLALGFGAYQLSVKQAQQMPLLIFLLRCLLGPLVTVLLFDLALTGPLLVYADVFPPGMLAGMTRELTMSYCIAIVGALGLSLLTGVGAAVGAATLGGLAGAVAVLVSLPLRESSWIVAGITLGTMCGTACGVLWMQRADTRLMPTRDQVHAVAWGLAESLVLVASLSLISLQFIQAQLYWGMERERAMGAVLGLLLVTPCLLAFFLRRREAPGQWFGTVLLGMVAVFAFLGAVLQPILASATPSALAFGMSVGLLAGVAVCGLFSMMHALAENFGAGPWSDLAPVLGTCLLLPLLGLAYAGSAGLFLSRLSGCLLTSGLLSFVMVTVRKWAPIRARYVGAGQRGSGPGVSPGVS
jgi:hypothetical protein